MAWRHIHPLLVLVLVTVPLAGCLEAGPTLEPTGADQPVEVPALAFEPSALLPHDTGAAEPNLAVHPDGTLFATAPVGLTPDPNAAEGSAWLWRSTDGGDTWEVLRDPHVTDRDPTDLGPWCSCDADVVASPDGWVYYTDWWSAGLVAGNYLVEASPDGGDTWTSHPVTMPRAVTFSVDRQWLVAGEDGFVGLFYHYNPGTGFVPDDGPLPGGRIEAVFSHDHGATWSAPVTVVEEPEGTFDQISKPRLLPDGTLAIATGHMTVEGDEFWTAPGEVRVSVSTDDGATWTQRTVAEVPEGFDNLWAVQSAVDDAGTLHVAWAARTGENMTVFHSESNDAGASWSEPTALRSAGLNFLPWVAARGDGEVAVGWYGGNAKGEPTDAPGDAPWFAYVAERSHATGNWTVTRVSPDPVKVGPLCPRGASCDGDRELLDYVSLRYTPSGELVVAYARSDTATEEDTPPALVHVTRELAQVE